MKQAGWNELFVSRVEPLVLTPEVPRAPQGWRRLFWWEDWLTFGLLAFVSFIVVASIQQARWVDDMPALYSITLLGLAMAALLAQVRWPEGVLHVLALPLGAAAILGQILGTLPGSNPRERFEVLVQRMGDWFGAAVNDGISSDSLPFIVLVVSLSWLAAYLSGWALFRWRNAWLALAPGASALVVNVSYLQGQFSFSFLVFLFGGALLVTRLHLMEQAKTWQESETPYPPFISLAVLHATCWLVLALLVVAWVMPRTGKSEALEALWGRATAPVSDRIQEVSRLFLSINGRGEFRVHRFEDTLPFRGRIDLPDTVALEVSLPSAPVNTLYLRQQAFDEYTPAGWKQGARETLLVDLRDVAPRDLSEELRQLVTLRVAPPEGLGEIIFTVGQPVSVDRPVRVRSGSVSHDIAAVESRSELDPGEAYQVTGSISVASEEALRAAGEDYPAWVRERYLQLPEDFSPRVRDLAQRLAGGQPTPYDKAVDIETYLRRIPYDLKVPDPPPGEDAVEYFLFEARRGYFDYHASAMVVLLRSLGVPARMAVGYALQPSDRDPTSGQYVVTEQSAFAWPEVYFPGLGWVEFNPTPSLPTIVRPDPQSGPAPSNSFLPPLGVTFGDPGLGEPEAQGAGDREPAPSTSSNRALWVMVGLLSALAVLLVGAGGGLSYAWLRGLGGLAPPARLWGQTVRLASWARLPPSPDQTPFEYARSLRERVPGLQQVDLLAESYVRHRYGRRPAGEAEEEQLERAWRAVRGALLRRLFRLT